MRFMYILQTKHVFYQGGHILLTYFGQIFIVINWNTHLKKQHNHFLFLKKDFLVNLFLSK